MRSLSAPPSPPGVSRTRRVGGCVVWLSRIGREWKDLSSQSHSLAILARSGTACPERAQSGGPSHTLLGCRARMSLIGWTCQPASEQRASRLPAVLFPHPPLPVLGYEWVFVASPRSPVVPAPASVRRWALAGPDCVGCPALLPTSLLYLLQCWPGVQRP